MNQEVLSLQAQVRQLKGEASELAAQGSHGSAILSLTDENKARSKASGKGVGILEKESDRHMLLEQKIEEMKKVRDSTIENIKSPHSSVVDELRGELKEMERKKDKYKSYFNQHEDHLTEEEEACKAESEACERIRNEYNEQVRSWMSSRTDPPLVSPGKSLKRSLCLHGPRWKRFWLGSP